MKRLTLWLACLFISMGLAIAQDKQISGTVVDESGDPVIGASVIVKGNTTVGTVTDVDGRFTLSVPGSAQTLIVKYLGMKDQEAAVASKVSVTLRSSASELDEVIVVAYGTAKKSSFTGSAGVIGKKKLENRNVSNISKALDGQVTGVMTTSGGGQPGDGANIRVRGYASINASSAPLYVVDGIPFDGSISSINPNDIENISVLKDASAGALYGARGANGVILITTKKGIYDGNVELKISHGWSSRAVKPYDMVNQKEYVQLVYEALRNGYIFGNGYSWGDAATTARGALGSNLGASYNPFKNYTWDTLIDPVTEQLRPDAVSAWNENWIDEVSNNGAPRAEYQVSFSGGRDNTTYMISLGYLSEDGVLKNTKFERFSSRGVIDHQAKDWLKTGLSTAISTSKQNYSTYTGTSTANVWYTAQFMAPIYPAYIKDAEGKNLLDSKGERQFDYGVSRPKAANFSPIATLYDDKFDVINDNVSTRSYLTFGSDDEKYGWAQGLKFTTNLGVDYRGQSQMIYYNPFHGNFSAQGGILEQRNTRLFSMTFHQLLNWKRTFDRDHTLDVLAGHESYSRNYQYLAGQKSGLVPNIYELDPAVKVDDVSSYHTDYKIESWLGRVNYNFLEKYYLDASIRTDGSSRFYKSDRWGTFWSVGANWQIGKEAFMNNVDWVDLLALKASYGIQGNDDILTSLGTSDYYLWASYYNFTWPNALQSGARITSLENKKVTWEKNANLNVGVEAQLFDKRMDVEIEYFNRKTMDLLLSYPMALSTGFSGYNANVGNLLNHGIEFNIGADIIKTNDFTWRTTVMGTSLKNKVLKLTENNKPIISGVRTIEVGKELHTYYMSKSAGVDPATGAQLYWVYDSDDNGNKISADYISSDKAKAAVSKYYQGSRIPKLMGNISMDFKYKGVDLSIVTSFSQGGKIYESLYAGSMGIMYMGDTWNKNVLRRWQKPGDVTDVPRMEINPSYLATDRWLVDASYISIRNISLGYTLPKSVLNKININTLRLFVSADNLYLFSHLNGMDPQFNFTGGTDYSYTPSRVVSVGLNARF